MANLPKFEGAWWEATKQILRIFVLAGLSAIVDYLLQVLVQIPSGAVIVLLTFVLTWIDQYLRENARLRKETKVKGLVPF